MKLYELADQVKVLESVLDSDFATDSPESFASVQEALDNAKIAFGEKLDAVAKVRADLLGDAEAIAKEIDRLQARKKAAETKADWLKDYAERCLFDAGQEKVKTVLYTFAIQKNPPRVEVVGTVPEEFLVHPAPTVDKKAILDRLKAGEELPYARLVQGESLRIR